MHFSHQLRINFRKVCDIPRVLHLHPDRGGQHDAVLWQQMSSVWQGRHLPPLVQQASCSHWLMWYLLSFPRGRKDFRRFSRCESNSRTSSHWVSNSHRYEVSLDASIYLNVLHCYELKPRKTNLSLLNILNLLDLTGSPVVLTVVIFGRVNERSFTL